jgi:Raf kinase inhibitor-like YbhB/YbcL family protein
MTFMLESPAFADGAPIPMRYSRLGENLSPPLRWKDAPEETKSFALVVEDPDAPSGTFRHWAVYDIDPNRSTLAEGAAIEPDHSGVNDFGHHQYDGPQPPRGHGVHRYHFRLAALDAEKLDVSRRAKVSDVWQAAKPHILAEAELVGTFETR